METVQNTYIKKTIITVDFDVGGQKELDFFTVVIDNGLIINFFILVRSDGLKLK